jgi:hypothetical protein
MSARDRRRALALGSFAKNGLIGVRVGVAGASRVVLAFAAAAGGCAGATNGRAGPLGRAGAPGIVGGAVAAGIVGVGRADGIGGIVGRGANAGGRAALDGGCAIEPAAGVPIAGRGGNIVGRGAGVVIGRGGTGGTNGGVAGRTTGRAAAGGVSVRGGVGDALGATGVMGATGADATAGCGVGANSSSIELPAPIVMTPPQTEQRARRPNAGIFVGSTRNTDRHSGQETFTSPPSLWPNRAASRLASIRRPATRRCVDRSRTRSREASSRSSSFQSRARSPAPRA